MKFDWDLLPGLITSDFAAARDFATADAIHLRSGEAFNANIAPERQRYYDVRIPLIPAELGGVPGLSVSVFAQGRRGPGFELGFDRSRNAIAGSLPNGNYTIGAMTFGPGGATGITNITVANGAVQGAPLTLAQDASIEVNIREDMTGADNNRVPRVRDAPNQPLASEAWALLGAGTRRCRPELCVVGNVWWQGSAASAAGGPVRGQRSSYRDHHAL